MTLWTEKSHQVTSKPAGNEYIVFEESTKEQTLEPKDMDNIYDAIFEDTDGKRKFRKQNVMKMIIITIGLLIVAAGSGSGFYIWWEEKYSVPISKNQSSMSCPSAKSISNADCANDTKCNNDNMCVQTEICCQSQCKVGRICTTAISMSKGQQGKPAEVEQVGNSTNMLRQEETSASGDDEGEKKEEEQEAVDEDYERYIGPTYSEEQSEADGNYEMDTGATYSDYDNRDANDDNRYDDYDNRDDDYDNRDGDYVDRKYYRSKKKSYDDYVEEEYNGLTDFGFNIG